MPSHRTSAFFQGRGTWPGLAPLILGYRVGEVDIDLREPTPEMRWSFKGTPATAKRRPAATLGPTFVGQSVPRAVRPRPDLSDPFNALAGAQHRFGCEMPTPDPGVADDFYRYFTTLVTRYFPRARGPVDLQDYLASVPYSLSRKLQLFAEHAGADGQHVLGEKHFRTESFIKAEGYDTFKAPRAINAYCDLIKIMMGPFIKLMDEALFSLHKFVKHIDVRDRAGLLQATFGDNPVMMTDFTSFEAHHQGIFARCSYFWMAHVLRDIAPQALLDVLEELVMGINVTQFAGVMVAVNQRLMSGASWTSSSNSALNFAICTYLVARSQHPDLSPEELAEKGWAIPAVFEGDDGITAAHKIDESLVAKLGIRLKFSFHENFGDGSFCGVLTDPTCLQVATDPYKVLADFPVVDARYSGAKTRTILHLLRCKAMSYAYAYPAAPVVTALARYHMRVTSGMDVRKYLGHMDLYARKQLLKALEMRVWETFGAPIAMETRMLVERKFGMSISDQFKIEAYLDSKDDISPLDVDVDFPPIWTKFASEYVIQPGSTVPDYPRYGLNIIQRWQWFGLPKRKSAGWIVPGAFEVFPPSTT